jgi:hypothetical protein
MPERNADAVEEEPPERKRPPGYRKFEKLLRQVVKSPPIRGARKPSTK